MKKIVFISGASRGIGKSIAEAFASAGYSSVITCKNSFEELRKVANEIEKKFSVSCTPMHGDMGQEEDVKRIFSSIPPVDILINNAGIDYIGLLSDMDIKDWNLVLSTNLTSAFLCCKEVIPSMIAKKRGTIINISSVWGTVGASMEVAYSTSKAGLDGFTKSLAKELAPSNIQVNAIACGLIDTKMNSCYTKDELNTIIQSIPADRIGTPDEIAQFVLQFSINHTYLTGQIIKIDGGWI